MRPATVQPITGPSVIELSGDLPPETVDRLAYGAYRSSRTSPVVLALRGLSVDQVQKAIDVAVQELGTGFAGVLYRTDQDVAVDTQAETP